MNFDHIGMFSRKPKISSQKQRLNKYILVQLFDNSSKESNNRKRFSYWEIDAVVLNIEKTDAVLLTLVEHPTYLEIILKVNEKDKDSFNIGIRTIQERSRAGLQTYLKRSKLMDLNLRGYTKLKKIL